MLGVLGALNSISRNPSLDRLIRGRTWIVLIAFALIGIVTLQLLVLRLNANIGSALVREAQLQRENAALSIESSELAAGERVESLATRMGMQLVPEGALRFLTSDPRADIGRAAAALSKPVQASSASSSETSGAGATGSGKRNEHCAGSEHWLEHLHLGGVDDGPGQRSERHVDRIERGRGGRTAIRELAGIRGYTAGER